MSLINEKYKNNYALSYNLDEDDYKRTFISIVTETLTDGGTLFISEKTWKPIMVGHPFMVYGNQGTLAYLKSLGYRTFDRWIDESYDLEASFIKKGILITRELLKLKKYSVDELKNIRIEMRDICKHNQDLFNKLHNKNYINRECIPLRNILLYIWDKLKDDYNMDLQKKLI